MAFTQGQSVPAAAIERLLVDVGVKGRIERLSYGYFRKVMAFVTRPGGSRWVVKIALGDYGAALLHNESGGYRSARDLVGGRYDLPEYRTLVDEPGFGVATMPFMTGRPSRWWQYPAWPLSRIATEVGAIGMRDWVYQAPIRPDARGVLEALEEVAQRIMSRYDGMILPTTPSHGDFCHWNVWRGAGKRATLFDFEYYCAARPACFDDLHWVLYPVFRAAVRSGKVGIIVQAAGMLPTVLWGGAVGSRHRDAAWALGRPRGIMRPLLVAYFFGMARTLLEEHRLPAITTLIGAQAFELRERVAQAYLLSLYRLLD